MNDNTFLIKIAQKIKDGDYDEFLIIPFQSQKLFLTTIKHKILKRVEKGGLPVLTDNEIKECIDESQNIALDLLKLYFESGFLIKNENGIELTELGHNAIKNLNN